MTPTTKPGEADLTARTPQDFAIEHAEYLAAGVEHLLTEVNDMMQAGRSSREAAEQDVFEAASKVQSLVYEFRKRRDRAALGTAPATPVPAPSDAQIEAAKQKGGSHQNPFEAGCEVLSWLRENQAPYGVIARMLICLHQNNPDAPARRTTPVQPVPASEPVPREPDGKMWSVGRAEFIRWAQRYEDARSADKASVIADVAGSEIFRAMWDATPTSPAPAPATQADAAEVGQWRPIESAPKDGSEILLGRAANDELEQYAISVPGYWQAGYEDGVDYMGVDDGFVDSHHHVFSGGRSFGAESYRYAPNQPTHWMPLPAAPADSSMGGGER